MGWFGHHQLGVALMCADWRPDRSRADLYKRLCRTLHVDGLDVNAVPRPDGLLDPARAQEWEAVAGWVKLLVGAHKPVKLAMIAHQRCAGHPVEDDRHEHDVLETAMALKEKVGFDGPVLALVATYNSDRSWGIKEIGVY